MKEAGERPPLLKLEGISKRFGGVTALEDVSLTADRGEILGLVGENGAGKSTLVRIIAGGLRPDGGELRIDGRVVENLTPEAAEALGTSVVHQELPICPNLTAAENIGLGPSPPRRHGFLDRRAMEARAAELFGFLEADIDPSRAVAELSTAEVQLVLIARALARGSRLIVLDEPTSALSPPEVRSLFGALLGLRDRGVGIIFVSHMLDEVLSVTGRIEVLRNGRNAGSLRTGGTSTDEVIRLMVGQEVESVRAESVVGGEETILSVRGLRQSASGLRDIDLDIRRGEIVGLAGLRGSGRSELAQTIIGYRRMDGGRIFLDGRPVAIESPARALELGLGYLPEDRGRLGLFHDLAVAPNLMMAVIGRLSRFGLVRSGRLAGASRPLIQRLNITTRGPEESVVRLSGGNQQKVLLGRWLAAKPRLLILDEPTRGVDVGARAEIHRLILNLAAEGVAIILISSDLNEVLALSGRIVVLRSGEVAGTIARREATREKVLSLAVRG